MEISRLLSTQSSRRKRTTQWRVVLLLYHSMAWTLYYLAAFPHSTEAIRGRQILLSSPVIDQHEALLSLSQLSSTLFFTCGSNHTTCDAQGRVLSINFTGSEQASLSGTLSPNLSTLHSLTSLNLPNNNFTGALPPELGTLHSLVYLNLSRNNFTGGLPQSWSNMKSLGTLDLGDNSFLFEGVDPVDLLDLPTIKHLSLRNTSLSGNLSLVTTGTLTYLDLANNTMTGGLPWDFTTLSSLRFLNLSANNLTGGLPPTFDSLAQLEVLYLAENLHLFDSKAGAVLGFPEPLLNMQTLTDLDLRNTTLSGPIPFSISKIASLKLLNLGYNFLNESLPPSLFELKKLTNLAAPTNYIAGSIPTELSQATQLLKLSLRNNSFTDPVPDFIANMSQLVYLDLRDNQMRGPLPKGIGALTNLTKLSLRETLLEGDLPDMSRMRNMVFLDMQRNKFTGPFPNLTGMTNATDMYLLDCYFTGELPYDISKMTALTQFHVTNNSMTGSIPASIVTLPHIIELGFGFNQFIGPVPAEISTLTKLVKLLLSSNRFTGPFPTGIFHLTKLTNLTIGATNMDMIQPGMEQVANLHENLKHLYAGNCSLPSGFLPAVGNLTRLEHLDLSNASLNEPIPPSISQLVELTELRLDKNRLFGELPEYLSALQSLQQCDLSNNNFNGTIPAALGEMDRLQRLNLAHNNLTGDLLPDVIQGLPYLTYLNLTGNPLTGSLPSELGLLSTLEVLDIPSAMPCPKRSCSEEQEGISTLALDKAFCKRCTSFCAGCPSTNVSGVKECLEGFENETKIETKWRSTGIYSGVTVDTEGQLTGISLASLPGGGVLNESLNHPNMSTLVTLSLINCSLTSSIGSSITNLRKLQELVLSDNDITGSIPDTLGSLSLLTRLSLQNNQLGGSSSQLCALAALRDLRILSLAQNPEERRPDQGFTGGIPQELGGLTNLQKLDLSGNALTGGIPPEFESLRALQVLNLKGTELQGVLPSFLASLPLDVLLIDGENLQCPEPITQCLYEYRDYAFCKICSSSCVNCPTVAPQPVGPTSPSAKEDTRLIAILAGTLCGAVVLLAAALTVYGLWRGSGLRDNVQKKGALYFTQREVHSSVDHHSKPVDLSGPGKVFLGRLRRGEDVPVLVRFPLEKAPGRKVLRSFRRDEREVIFDEHELMHHELAVLSGVHHRNVLELIGYSLSREMALTLVYKSSPLGTLHSLLHSEGDQPSLSLEDKLHVALSVALGLDYIHSQASPPVVHCNISSRSVLVSGDYSAQICDFSQSFRPGIDKLDGGVKDIALRGCHGYVDPEYVKSGVPTISSDVYSFGVLLLELATGSFPIEGKQHVLVRALASLGSSPGGEETLQRIRSCGAESMETAPSDEERHPSPIEEGCGSQPISPKGEVEKLMELGVQCCNTESGDRPQMRLVAESLEALLRKAQGLEEADKTVLPDWSFTQTAAEAAAMAESAVVGDAANRLDLQALLELALGEEFESVDLATDTLHTAPNSFD